MTDKKIRKLAVSDNGNIVGIITSTDLVTQLTK
jgi:CBS domain-containing protein